MGRGRPGAAQPPARRPPAPALAAAARPGHHGGRPARRRGLAAVARGFTAVDELGPGEVLHRRRADASPASRAVHSGHRWGPRSTHGPDAARHGPPARPGDGAHRLRRRGHRRLPGDGRAGPRSTSRCCRCGAGAPTLGPGHLDPAGAAAGRARCCARGRRPGALGHPRAARPTCARGRRRMRRLLVDPPRRFAADVAAAGLATTRADHRSPAPPSRCPPRGRPRERPGRGLDRQPPRWATRCCSAGCCSARSCRSCPPGRAGRLAAAVAMTTDRLAIALVLLLAIAAALHRRPRHLRRRPVRRARGGRAGSPAGSTPTGSRRCAGSSARTAGRSSSSAGCCPPGRIPVLLAAGALAYPWRRLVPASLRRRAAVGGGLRAARRRQRRHLRLPAGRHARGHRRWCSSSGWCPTWWPRRRRRATHGPSRDPSRARPGDRTDRPPAGCCAAAALVARVLLVWALTTARAARARPLADRLRDDRAGGSPRWPRCCSACSAGGGLAAAHAGRAAARASSPSAWAASWCSAPACWASSPPSPASWSTILRRPRSSSPSSMAGVAAADQQPARRRRGRGVLPPRRPPPGRRRRRPTDAARACCSCRSTAWATTPRSRAVRDGDDAHAGRLAARRAATR